MMKECIGGLIALLLLSVSFSPGLPNLTSLPQPIVKDIDLHYAPPTLTTDPPGNPYFRDSVTLRATLSLEAKQTWTKYGVVLDKGAPGDNDSREVSTPSLLYDQGIYKMWYSGNDGGEGSWILYATSPDGISWTRHGTVLGPGGAGEDRKLVYQFVMKDGAMFKMWYSGFDGSNYRIFHATSPDGIAWTKKGLVLDLGPAGSQEDFYVYDPYILKEGSTYRMWYTGRDVNHCRIFYTESSDGVNWGQRSVSLNLGSPGSEDDAHVQSPSILREGGGYHMWYAGQHVGVDRIFYAVSIDGKTWTGMGKVLDVGPAGGTEDMNVNFQDVLHLTSKPSQMWYAGRGGFGNLKIHYATLVPYPLPTNVTVGFYLDTVVPSSLIGLDTVTLDYYSSAQAEVQWKAGPRGTHTICAVIDPYNSITEMNETNNMACINRVVLNHPPIAEADGPYSAFEGGQVILDGSGSYDIDNDTLLYRWDFTNDGVMDTPWRSNPKYPHVYGDDFVGQVALYVNDSFDVSMDTANVTISNVLPSGTVTITSAQHEGSPIAFSAHVTDPGSDDIFFTWHWGFGAPDDHSTYYNNGVSPDPYPSTDVNPRDVTDVKSHIYGDNGAFTVTVFIQDDDSGSQGTTLTITATPDNLPPSISVSGGMNINEGQSVSLTATATDPGSDDLKFDWSWGEGSSDSKTYYNDGVGPDPPDSPGGTFPFTATDTRTHPYGDNGLYTLTLAVNDDDGGSTTWSGQVAVANLPPTIIPFGPFAVDEGSPLAANTTANDPGSDDLTFEWSFELGPVMVNIHFNDGVGPDPPQSPDGTYPFTALDGVEHTYGDNAVFTITLTVTDDDGGSATYTTNITVSNLPPSIAPFGPFELNEADPLTVAANAVDPGSDDLTFTWSFEYGPTIPHIFYNDGVGPDPPKSPDGVFPFSIDDSASQTYGDNGVFRIALTAEDDDGGIAAYETVVTVHNVPPTIVEANVFMLADISIRVAGEKWHDVILKLYEDGREVGWAQVIRYPGSPNGQMATLHDVEITLDRTFSAVAYYTPDDDPINGQPNGANPAWLIISWESGMETKLHHTFNVQHPDTWVWTVDNLYIYAVNQRIHFRATATDPGSDDLTFTWDTGDGRTMTGVYYNNGVSPDPYPSPEVKPIIATDEQVVVYAITGTYTIAVTVTDDDGGMASISFTISVG